MHFNFLCRQGPQDSGTLFLFRTTLNCASGGDCPALDDVVEGGVGGIVQLAGLVELQVVWDGATGLYGANSARGYKSAGAAVSKADQGPRMEGVQEGGQQP